MPKSYPTKGQPAIHAGGLLRLYSRGKHHPQKQECRGDVMLQSGTERATQSRTSDKYGATEALRNIYGVCFSGIEIARCPLFAYSTHTQSSLLSMDRAKEGRKKNEGKAREVADSNNLSSLGLGEFQQPCHLCDGFWQALPS